VAYQKNIAILFYGGGVEIESIKCGLGPCLHGFVTFVQVGPDAFNFQVEFAVDTYICVWGVSLVKVEELIMCRQL
jgi:hypothetical protein